MDDFEAQTKQLQMRGPRPSVRSTRIADAKQQLGTEKAEIDAKAAKAKKLLGTLKARAAAKARAEAARLPGPRRGEGPRRPRPAVRRPHRPPPAHPHGRPASGRAAAAVSYAMAQVGKAYVYGAAGPSAFDCSGLTMAAWAQAGVGLPHSSSAQYGSGTAHLRVASCSPATWSSTTARSATSACTSATA